MDGDSAIAVQGALHQRDGRFPIDVAVCEALPRGVRFVSAEPFGTSAWTVTGKITGQAEDGSEQHFFLKTAFGEHGGVMMKGEYESAQDILQVTPGLIPKPISFGKYQAEDPVTYFYLSEFVDMDTTAPPNPSELASKLAQLHKRSSSPTGKFGYHVVTCDGKMPHLVEWTDSWDVFFGKLLRRICEIDVRNNGPWPELERAAEQVISKVVPRLLHDLRTEGDPIKPCLIHGDLWEPNMGLRVDSGDLVIFDVSSYYAHNEMDVGSWRADYCSHLRTKTYIKHYLGQYPAAEPAEEFDDRNRLYSLKGSINYSAGHPDCAIRQTVYNNMCYLCEKYAPIDGIGPYDPQKDPSVTGARLIPSFIKPT